MFRATVPHAHKMFGNEATPSDVRFCNRSRMTAAPLLPSDKMCTSKNRLGTLIARHRNIRELLDNEVAPGFEFCTREVGAVYWA